MNEDKKTIFAVLEDIEQQGYQCALVGGFAVGARARERFTKDVDFAVAVEHDEAAERLIGGLLNRGYTLHSWSTRLADVYGALDSRVRRRPAENQT